MRRKYNWDLLKRGAEAWHNIAFDGEFSVNVGDASGTLFKWESPGFSSHGTRMAGASLSKWPAATMLVGLVADGTLSFDEIDTNRDGKITQKEFLRMEEARAAAAKAKARRPLALFGQGESKAEAKARPPRHIICALSLSPRAP